MRAGDPIPVVAVSAHWAPAVLAAAGAAAALAAGAPAELVTPALAVRRPARGRRATFSDRRVRIAFARIVRRLEADGWPT
ncbi:hypothetical protein ACDF64_17700 [Agromyces sp. MMS24-JH15]|uniref:hypothetical protein n=1 Tax=Agromyces sp. MMS24-JH15 TaxID=3243765 RepID=UPI003749438E